MLRVCFATERKTLSMQHGNPIMNETDNVNYEELVAYLDGELEPDQVQDVDQRLATDPALRRALQKLENSWEALDTLPRTDLNEDFTKTTVELIAVEADEEVTRQLAALPNRQRLWWLATAAAVLVAAGIGFLSVRVTSVDPDEELIRDLAVLENLELYRDTGDVEFLQELDQSGLFGQEGTRE